MQSCDWSENLRKLGLKGAHLTVALERKNRSLIKAHALHNSGTGGMGSTGKGEQKPGRVSLLPMNDDVKGWASTTGTIVL